MLNTVDPTQTTALDFLDFGSVYSSDGREHPITGTTPAYSFSADPSTDPSTTVPVSNTGAPSSQSSGKPSLGAEIVSAIVPSLPQHFGARLIVAIIGLLIIAIVVARLVLK